jgi:twitching motility protein PilT
MLERDRAEGTEEGGGGRSEYESARRLLPTSAQASAAGLTQVLRQAQVGGLEVKPPLRLLEQAHLLAGIHLICGPRGLGRQETLRQLLDAIATARPEARMVAVESYDQTLRSDRLERLTVQPGQQLATLRHIIRQDPDVLVVPEIFTADQLAEAGRAAEVGILVVASLNAGPVEITLPQLLSHSRGLLGEQLAATLLTAVSQRLVPRLGGGQVAAFDLLLGTPAVRNIIRAERCFERHDDLRAAMQTGVSQGMQTLSRDLARLAAHGEVGEDVAYAFSADRREYRELLAAHRDGRITL